MPLMDRRPTGLLRLLLRLPILLYKARAGWLLGHRFVYIAHRGRRSGARREVVVEVVRYLPAVPELAVVAAWGRHPDWYLNLEAGPAVEVRIGTQVWRRPEHRLLDAKGTVELLLSYQNAHPRVWKHLAPVLGLPVNPKDTELAAVHAVVFTPRSLD